MFTAEAYSILGIIEDAILSKTGAITVAYRMENPEPYTLDESTLEARHQDFMRALKGMPEGSYFHKQDVFLKKSYTGDLIPGDSFLQRSERTHFTGRHYLDHHCIVAFTLTGLATLEVAYQQNPFSYKEKLVKKDSDCLAEFLEAVEAAVTILNSIPNTSIHPMGSEDLKYYIYKYVNAFSPDEGLKDIHFGQRLEIGDAIGAYFAITDENYLPDQIPVYAVDDTLPISNARLSMAYLEKLGVHLHCNHVFNQIIFFEGNHRLREELDGRVTAFAQAFGMGSHLNHTYKKLKAFQEEVQEEQAILCRAHFSVLTWDNDTEEVRRSKDFIREILRTKDITYYEPIYEGLRDIFIGTVIGRENKLAPGYFFLTDTGVALTLFINYSVFRNDAEGVFFNDRIFQIPLQIDVWDARKQRMPARNAIVVASTGGGKSSACLNILQQFIEQNIKAVVVEFGNSFEALTRLYPERSAHIQYDGSTPLGINPFYIQDKSELTIEKLKTIAVIVLKFWRIKEIRDDTLQVVSLTKILKDYYDHTGTGHSFPDFYNYVKQHHQDILRRNDIPEEYFEVHSFIHVCSEFMPGGIYQNICIGEGEEGNEDKIRNKDFVVFELTGIKKDPFLVSVVMSIIFETVENKILSNRSEKGVLLLDEYAESANMKDVLSGDDVHSSVAFFYQKLRKENGAIYTIIQSPAQLPEGHYTKGIIANTQLLMVLPTTETVYDHVIDTFHIKNTVHINLLKSIRNDFSGKRKYSELFMRFQDHYATVCRLEFSPQKYFAFQTDGEVWQYLTNSFKITGNMEESINHLIKSK